MEDKEYIQQLEQRLKALEDAKKAEMDAAEKAKRDEKYRLSMLGHENMRWDFSPAMQLLPSDPNLNDVRLQQVGKNQWLNFDRWGINPDFIKRFPNKCVGSGFEWYNPANGKPYFWVTDGRVTDASSWEGTVALKLEPGQKAEQGTLYPVHRRSQAGADPVWWDNYQTRVSFKHKGGAVRVSVKPYPDQYWSWDESESPAFYDPGWDTHGSYAKCKNGDIIAVSGYGTYLRQAYCESLDVFLTRNNSLTDEIPLFEGSKEVRGVVFNDNKGNLYLGMARRANAASGDKQQVHLYKSASGNGKDELGVADWELYSIVRETEISETYSMATEMPLGAPLILPSGRWVWPCVYFIFQNNFNCNAAIYTSDDEGKTWDYRTNKGNSYTKCQSTTIASYGGRLWWVVGSLTHVLYGDMFYYSNDNGETWTQAYNKYFSATVGQAGHQGALYVYAGKLWYMGLDYKRILRILSTTDPMNPDAWQLVYSASGFGSVSSIGTAFTRYFPDEQERVWCIGNRIIGRKVVDSTPLTLVDNSEEGLIDKYGNEVGVIRQGEYLDYDYIENWAYLEPPAPENPNVPYLVTGYHTFYFQPIPGQGKLKICFENIDDQGRPCYIDAVQIEPDFTGKWPSLYTPGPRSISPIDVIGMPGIGTPEWDEAGGTVNQTPSEHANTHKTGAVDELTPDDIGAAEEVHNLIDATNHPASGLTAGHFLKATGETTYDFEAHGLSASDVGALAKGSLIHDPYDEGTHTGLDFSYGAGLVRDDNIISTTNAGTVTLTDDSTNYIEVDPSSGVVSANTTGFTEGKIPLYEAVTVSGEITVITDRRAYLGAGGAGGTSELPDHMEWVNTETAEGLAVYDDPPTNSNMVALIGRKGTLTSVYLEDEQTDFEQGELDGVEAEEEGLGLAGLSATNFSEYTTGVAPSDWTPRWVTTGVNWRVRTTGGEGGKSLRAEMTSSTNARRGLSWNGKDKKDIDVTAKVLTTHRNTSTTVTLHMAVAVRGSGTSGSETLYVALLRYGTSGGGTFEIGKYVAGSYSNIAILDYNWSTNTEYFIRFRVIGNSLKAKIWTGTVKSEPAGWMLEGTDSDITAAGWTGFFNFYSGGSTHRYEYDLIKIRDFMPHGNRTTLPLDLTSLGTNPGLRAAWQATIPEGTSVTIETAVTGETSYTDENIGTGDGAEDTFYLPAYPAERHDDLVIKVDGTPTTNFTRPGEEFTLYLGGATGGTFTLGDGTTNTSALNYNDSAATIETALEAIYGSGKVTVTADTDFTIAFDAGIRESGLEADLTSLTGATNPALTATETNYYPKKIVFDSGSEPGDGLAVTATYTGVTNPSDAGDWEEQTSKELITNIPEGDLTGKHLWVRETLETTDTIETPTLSEVEVYYGEEEYGVFTTSGTVGTL
jgi:hypothetical protein